MDEHALCPSRKTKCPPDTSSQRLRERQVGGSGFVKKQGFSNFFVALELFYRMRTYPRTLVYESYRIGDALVETGTRFGLRTGARSWAGLDHWWYPPPNPHSGIWDLIFHWED